MLFKPLDLGIVITALGAVIASFLWIYSGNDGRLLVNIKSQNDEWIFPTDSVATVDVPGPLGNTVIEIRNGQARIMSSPCPNQTCVASGAVHASGQWAACLPNRVMLYISEGEIDNDIDAAVW